MQKINVIIPVFNESGSIGHVLQDIPANLVKEVIVVNNGSTDNTAEIAHQKGATVLLEERKGYGSACLKGINYIKNKPTEDNPILLCSLTEIIPIIPNKCNCLFNPLSNRISTW